MAEAILAICVSAGALAGGVCFWGVSRRNRGKGRVWSIERAAATLGSRIRESGFNPDVVVTAGRGGSTVGPMVVKELGLASLVSLYRRYDWTIDDSGNPQADFPRNLDLTGLRVLLVTGTVNTGKTLQRAFNHVLSRAPKDVRTASVFKVDTAQFTPDYHVYQVKSSEELPLWR